MPAHPRMFFGSTDIPGLRNKAATTHAEIWAPILIYVASQVGVAPPSPQTAYNDVEGMRNNGNKLIAFAFAAVITGDPVYVTLARDYLVAFAGWAHWGDETGEDYIDLLHHHMLFGNAIAYDWIYNDLSEADRVTIRTNLIQRARESYNLTVSVPNASGNWWRRAYTHNHCRVAYAALGIAAMVLEAEDGGPRTWEALILDRTIKAMALDVGNVGGTWHESLIYENYALMPTVALLYNLRRRRATDLFADSFLRDFILMRVYNLLPSSDHFVLSFGDFAWSWGNGWNVESTLRFCASEYQDGYAEWMAQAVVADYGGRAVSVYTVPWYVLEFLYYDPSVVAVAPAALPLDRTFVDADAVIWRTGWGATDLTFGLICGAYGGRYSNAQWIAVGYPWTRAGDESFNCDHDHQDAGTFYFYRGAVDLASEVVGSGAPRATAYHNTLLVDGLGQYRDIAVWWTPASNYGDDLDGVLERAVTVSNFCYLAAEASNRYCTSTGSGTHGAKWLTEFKRHVIFSKPNYLVMVDNIAAAATHQYDWVAHCGSDVISTVTLETDWVKGISDANQVIGIKILAPATFHYTIGDDGKDYIQIHPAVDVDNTQFIMVLYPINLTDWAAKPDVTLLGNAGGAAGVRVALSGTQDHLVRYAGAGSIALDDYAFDASAASIIKDAGGALVRLFMALGLALSDTTGTRVLLQSAGAATTVSVAYNGAALALSGTGLTGLSIYAPIVDTAQVTVDGASAVVHRSGDYIVVGP